MQGNTTNSSKFAKESMQHHMMQGGSTANAMQYHSQNSNNEAQNTH
jgi:hypothetical protein